jgi:hypothetical protein
MALLSMFMPLLHATPANKAALERHYDRFLSKDLARCTTCHLPSPNASPETLDEFPHNPFGNRLRRLGQELKQAGQKNDLATRLKLVAHEDADGDGVDNETELLLGHNPGDAKDTPAKNELAEVSKRQSEFTVFLASYRWNPFEPVQRPPVPATPNPAWARNPIDAFIDAEHAARNLHPRPEAPKEILLRRVYVDLIGLSPTPDEQRAFEADTSHDAYEKVVDRLLDDSRYGERWGRHWMDVWRYSDWAGWSGGNQIRDSQPHIWRWRDWIIESLNADKGYDRMILEMLAADELAPEDPGSLRATGYLVRNYKMLSREQWLEDTLKHTSQAFLGLTVGCAKCHDHKFDPISQTEYYRLRAIFEPHQVRTDRIPGQLDTAKDGLVRVFDTDTNASTYFYIRGDERRPDTNRVMSPGVLSVLGGNLQPEFVKLPRAAAQPDRRDFVVREMVAASEQSATEARAALTRLQSDAGTKPEALEEARLKAEIAEAKHAALVSILRAEALEDDPKKDTLEWTGAATEAANHQKEQAIAEAKLKIHLAHKAQDEAQHKAEDAAKALEADNVAKNAENEKASADQATERKKSADKAKQTLEDAKKKTAEAETALADAQKPITPPTAYKPRPASTYPAVSTGRRLAFARWIADPKNPLTARVAVNQIWLRHFGQGIVATPADFGRNGRAPSHPQLLDWLAAEFTERGWSMKAIHRLILTSAAYRMASTPDEADARIDPDNIYLWRMPSRRMEAELVRDNLLYTAGDLDPAMGGPDIDNNLGLASKRRSLYLRIAAEKDVEFLRIFDGPTVTECYARRPTVVPQQALALANSELSLAEAHRLSEKLSTTASDDAQFVADAIERIFARRPKEDEAKLCRAFLQEQSRQGSPERARQELVLVLFNHNDAITIR